MRGLAAGTKAKISGYSAYEKRLSTCLGLTLKIDSMLTNAGLKYVSHVDITVKLNYSVSNDTYAGTGTIGKVVQKFADPFGNCTVKLTFTPAPFAVKRLALALDKEYEIVNAILQDYTPGQTNESAAISCPKMPTQTIPFMNWGMAYTLVHGGKQNYSVEDWKAGKKPLLLGKHIEQSFGEGEALITESTDYVLFRSR